MIRPRDVLNELKWRSDRAPENAEIWCISRGAPNDTEIIMGNEIRGIGRGFFELDKKYLPSQNSKNNLSRKNAV